MGKITLKTGEITALNTEILIKIISIIDGVVLIEIDNNLIRYYTSFIDNAYLYDMQLIARDKAVDVVYKSGGCGL